MLEEHYYVLKGQIEETIQEYKDLDAAGQSNDFRKRFKMSYETYDKLNQDCGYSRISVSRYNSSSRTIWFDNVPIPIDIDDSLSLGLIQLEDY